MIDKSGIKANERDYIGSETLLWLFLKNKNQSEFIKIFLKDCRDTHALCKNS